MKLYDVFLKYPTICTDSRNTIPNSIFFALQGDNFNANAYALSALEKGCRFAVIDDKKYAIDERFIVVENVLDSLQTLATFHRKQLGLTVIGITGTNGKTTTKELISSVLKEKYTIHFTQGNLNNHIGVPLTLLQLKKEHEIAVVEMGANHIGEIETLSRIAQPDFGIITNVGKAHLEGFGSLEGVMKAKGELYQYLEKTEGKIFVNSGNENLLNMLQKAKITQKGQIVSYQINHNLENNIVVGTISSNTPFIAVECENLSGKFLVNTQLIGDYNCENILAAVAIGAYFDLSNKQIKAGLEQYKPQNNRSQFVKTDRNRLIIDAYNANPTSMKAAIENFSTVPAENKLFVIGDMLELGDDATLEHQNIIELLLKKGIKNGFLVGKQFKLTTHHIFQTFETIEELECYIENRPIENQFILIKGSRGIQLEKIVPLL